MAKHKQHRKPQPKKLVLRELNLSARDFIILEQAARRTIYQDVGTPLYIEDAAGGQDFVRKEELFRVLKELRDQVLALRVPAAPTVQRQGTKHAALCYTTATAGRCVCGLADMLG